MPELGQTIGRLLILDDDADVLKAARLAVLGEAEAVDLCAQPAELQDRIADSAYDVVLLDMNFAPGAQSGREGLVALELIQAADPEVSVVLMTVYGGVSLAVEALKRGACDFVLKPWRNDKLVEALAAASDLTRSRRGEGRFNLEIMERHTIQRALARYDGNVSQAAAALGLTRPALYRRMAKHGL